MKIRFAKQLLRVIALLLFFLTGLYLLIPYYPDFARSWVTRLLPMIYGSEYFHIVYGLILALLPLVYFLLWIYQLRENKDYVIKGREGNSIISETSIIKSLVSAVKTVPSVEKVKPSIQNEGGALTVIINAQIKLDHFAPNICDRIRKRARSALTDVLGVTRINRIDVNIPDVKLSQGLLADRIRKSEKKEKEESAVISRPEKKPAPQAISPQKQK